MGARLEVVNVRVGEVYVIYACIYACIIRIVPCMLNYTYLAGQKLFGFGGVRQSAQRHWVDIQLSYTSRKCAQDCAGKPLCIFKIQVRTTLHILH